MSSCSRHASKEAVGFCINCGELVCAACHKEIDGKSYCQACVDKLFAARTVTPADNAAPASPAPVKPPLSEKKARIEAVPVLQSTKSAEPKAPAVEKTAAAAGTDKSGISWAWWIPPIILGWIGGLVSWLPNKDSEPKTARNMLFAGIGVSALQSLLSIILIIALIVPAVPEPDRPSTISLKPAEPTDTSSVQPSGQPAVAPGGEPADVRNAANKTPEPVKEAIVRTTVVPKLTPLVTKRLEPSTENQTVSYKDQITVTVPAGILRNRGDVIISSVENVPKPRMSAAQQIAVYDINIAGQHSFDSELTVELAYDPAKIRTDVPPENALSVNFLGQDGKTWFAEPFEVDAARNKVIIHPNHCSLVDLIAIGMSPQDMIDKFKGIYGMHRTNNFTIVYSNGDFSLPSDESQLTPEQYGTYPELNYKSRGDRWRSKGVPDMIGDCGTALEQAMDAYRQADFSKKLFPPINIFFERSWMQDMGLIDEADQYNSTSGNIIMSYVSTDWNKLGYSASHELFHALQNKYFNLATMKSRTIEWWLESTAEYAAAKIAMKTNFLRKMTPEWSGTSLMTNENYHAQEAAYFIDYLVSKKGIKFAEMFNAVCLNSSGVANNLRDFVYAKTSDDKGDQLTLAEHYRDFAEYVMFDPAGPFKEQLKINRRSADRYEQEHSFTLPAGLSAKYVGIQPEIASGKSERQLIVQVDGELPDYCRVDVYVLDKNQRISGNLPAIRVGTLDRYIQHTGHKNPLLGNDFANLEKNVVVNDGDALYILATNHSMDQAHDIKVRILDPLKPTLQVAILSPLVNGKGVIGDQYEFERRGTGIPPTAIFSWTVDGNQVGEGEKVLKQRFWNDNLHYIKIKASWPKAGASWTDRGDTEQITGENKIYMGTPKLTLQGPDLAGGVGITGNSYTFTIKDREYMPGGTDYSWDINGKQIDGDSNSSSPTFESFGKFTVTVKGEWATPDGSKSTSASASLTVDTPRAYIKAVPSVGVPGKETLFMVEDNIPVEAVYTWNFGDGGRDMSSLQPDGSVTHLYTAPSPPEKYKVTLKVSDANGQKSLCEDAIAYEVAGTPSLSIHVPSKGKIDPDKTNVFQAVPTNIPKVGTRYTWYIGNKKVLSVVDDLAAEVPPCMLIEGEYKMRLVAEWTGSDSQIKSLEAIAPFSVDRNLTLSIILPDEIRAFKGVKDVKYNFTAKYTNLSKYAKLTWYQDDIAVAEGDRTGLIFSDVGPHTVKLKAAWQVPCKAEVTVSAGFDIGNASSASTPSTSGTGWYLDKVETYSKLGAGKCSDGAYNGTTGKFLWTEFPKFIKPGGKFDLTYSTPSQGVISIRWGISSGKEMGWELQGATGAGESPVKVPPDPPSSEYYTFVIRFSCYDNNEAAYNDTEAAFVKYIFRYK